MTQAEIADLVERARAAEVRVRTARIRKASRAGVEARHTAISSRAGVASVTDTQRAVAYAYLHHVSVETAAEEYDVPLADVIVEWHRTHDVEPRRKWRRG